VRYRIANRAFSLWMVPRMTGALERALHRFHDRERAALRSAR
jgi:hypothetical protein